MSHVFGLCAGCAQYRKLVVDHNHETGKVRGLICNPCNCALGFVRDEPDTMLRLIEYLKAPPMASLNLDWGSDVARADPPDGETARPEVRMLPDPHTTIDPEVAESTKAQIIKLLHRGLTIPAIVEQVYGMTRIRGTKYAEASEMVTSIIRETANGAAKAGHPPSPISTPDPDLSRVAGLFNEGASIAAIVLELYGVKPGGGRPYGEAMAEVTNVIRGLTLRPTENGHDPDRSPKTEEEA
jgi:hypothetical protein